MTSDISIKQHQQQTITASEQKTSASDTSVWNNPRTTESTVQQEETHYSRATESVEDVYNKFIKDIVDNYNCASEQEVTDILDRLGFTKEAVLQLSKEDFYNFTDNFTKIFEYIYETNGDKEQKINNISDLINHSNVLSDKLEVLSSVSDFAEISSNATLYNMIRSIAKSTDIDLPKEIQEKLKKVKNISELSNDEINAIVMTLIAKKDILEKNNNMNTEQFLLNLFFNIPESCLEQNPILRELLIDAVEGAMKTNAGNNADNSKKSVIFLAMLKKLKNSDDGLQSACSDQMVGNVVDNIKTPEQAEKFLLYAQEIIDSGNAEQKTILADSIAKYLESKFEQKIQLDLKLQRGENLTQEEQDFLDIFKKLEQKYEALAGYAYVRAQKTVAAGLHQAGERIGGSFNYGAYQRAYNYSLKDNNVDPVDTTQRIDEISNNKYSQVLTDLGYELPTYDNINRLREDAEQGVFDNKIKEYYASEQDSGNFGYQQSPKSTYENAYANADTLHTQIIDNSQTVPSYYVTEADNVSSKTNNKASYRETINPANLSCYSGSKLSEMISNGFMKFSDVVKQYSSSLSESGKKFIIASIKVMDKSRQAFALNCLNNTARWEIMKKANLLDKNLKVNFDFNHEKLLEKHAH